MKKYRIAGLLLGIDAKEQFLHRELQDFEVESEEKPDIWVGISVQQDKRVYPEKVVISAKLLQVYEEAERYVVNLRVSRNVKNLGFVRNCNEAAKLCRGQYILFLNNDTSVQTGWLMPLVELLEQDASIGMVGSKLVYGNGKLQEAGGIFWKDASAWNYGHCDKIGKPEYNYVKEVDYISGASIMIRKSLWEQIGGFDER